MRILKRAVIPVFLMLLLLALSACGPGAAQVVETNFTFDNDEEGWNGGFADLPLEHPQQGYDVSFSYAEIPVLDAKSQGLFLTGNNHSDDLFMYLVRQFGPAEGLKADTAYNVTLSFRMATDVPSGMMGIGGSPGESVYIKAGVVDREPKSVERSGSYVLNIDKGNQSQEGADMSVVGNAAKGEGSGQGDESFQYKPFELSLQVTSSSDGELWVIIGADSGFEGISRLYFDDVKVTFNPIAPVN
jgi:hypothetical protein